MQQPLLTKLDLHLVASHDKKSIINYEWLNKNMQGAIEKGKKVENSHHMLEISEFRILKNRIRNKQNN